MAYDHQFLLCAFRVSAHESGHMVMSLLKKIVSSGIGFDTQGDECRLCYLVALPEELSQDHYLFLASGVAAERLFYGTEEKEKEGGVDDKDYFKRLGAPDFEETVKEAVKILSKHESKIRLLANEVKRRVQETNGECDSLPVVPGMPQHRLLLTLEEVVSLG
jgi:hypothetical protein